MVKKEKGEVTMGDVIFNEKYLTQIPALQALMKLGYTYISPSEAFKHRKKGLRNVLLEDILEAQLRKLNVIAYRKKKYAFSDGNIFLAIAKLRRLCQNYTIYANQEIYDLISLPQSMEEAIEGHIRSFNLYYVDWENWENNVYHCTSEYIVECSQNEKATRPDIVLFINGIPLAVIECKSPDEDINQAISQHMRNQDREQIPHLYAFGQLLVVVNKNQGQYDYEMTKNMINENDQCSKVCEEAGIYSAEPIQVSFKLNWTFNFRQDIDAQNHVKLEIKLTES
jgi:type I restriction enzyme R subunit